MQADVRALVTADAAQIDDLQTLAGQAGSSVSSWLTTWTSDSAKASAAASVVCADLGLPAPTP